MPDAQNLKRRTGGIREWTQQVECGAYAELAPNLRDASGGCVKQRREHETDSMLIQTALGCLGWAICIDSERFEDVGASRIRGHSPRAMFCYGHTRASDYESSGCRDIESLRSARTSSCCVYETRVT